MNPLGREGGSILLVSDDASVYEEVSRAVSGSDLLEACEDEASALAALEQYRVDWVLIDANLSDGSIWQFAERLRREHPGIDLVLLADSNGNDASEIRDEWLADIFVRPMTDKQWRRAIERLGWQRDMARENRRMRDSLHVVEECRALTLCLEPGKVYPLALDLLLKLLSRERGVTLFERPSTPQGDAAAYRGLEDGAGRRLRELLLDEKPLREQPDAAIEVVEGGQCISLVQNAGISVERLLVVPLSGREGESGVIWIFEDGRPFGEDELEVAEIVASYGSMALENCEHYLHAKERAFIDDVTEVYNARYLLSTTENEIRRAQRYENHLSVLFLDLDRFKLVNDRHGHLVGSQTLRRFSQVLGQAVRDVDTLARYGGDEFTILLVDTDHSEALSIANRIRRTVEDQIFEAGREGSLRLTVSIGVGTYPEHGEDRNSLLDAADKAMYRSKSLGRNRVCSADELAD